MRVTHSEGGWAHECINQIPAGEPHFDIPEIQIFIVGVGCQKSSISFVVNVLNEWLSKIQTHFLSRQCETELDVGAISQISFHCPPTTISFVCSQPQHRRRSASNRHKPKMDFRDAKKVCPTQHLAGCLPVWWLSDSRVSVCLPLWCGSIYLMAVPNVERTWKVSGNWKG